MERDAGQSRRCGGMNIESPTPGAGSVNAAAVPKGTTLLDHDAAPDSSTATTTLRSATPFELDTP